MRTVIGLVGQDAYLFDATIAENLAVGKRDATDDELRDVLDRVGLADWLEGLPRGLGTPRSAARGPALGWPAPAGGGGPGAARRLPRAGPRRAGEHLDPPAADALTADLLGVTDGRSLVLITHRLAGLETSTRSW